jgi:hypothetical protein
MPGKFFQSEFQIASCQSGLMHEETANQAVPPILPPGDLQEPPPVITGPPALEPRPFHGLLFFLSGMVCLFVLLMFVHQVGDRPDKEVVSGREVVVVGLVIAYFGISAAGMACAESKATLIKFALAAHLALFFVFAFLGYELVTGGGIKGDHSFYNILLAVTEVIIWLALLLPWHSVWHCKLRAQEKPATPPENRQHSPLN